MGCRELPLARAGAPALAPVAGAPVVGARVVGARVVGARVVGAPAVVAAAAFDGGEDAEQPMATVLVGWVGKTQTTQHVVPCRAVSGGS